LQSLDYSGEQRRAGNNEEEVYDAHFASQR
jgi:hypothetical protein